MRKYFVMRTCCGLAGGLFLTGSSFDVLVSRLVTPLNVVLTLSGLLLCIPTVWAHTRIVEQE